LLALWFPSEHKKEELEVDMSIQWPLSSSHETGEPPSGVDSITIRLPIAGTFGLTYIPKSTTLSSPFGHFLYHLPDGILGGPNDNKFPGIGLEDIGAPESCAECIDAYMRIVSFQARVT
jgi:hypothetical protein